MVSGRVEALDKSSLTGVDSLTQWIEKASMACRAERWVVAVKPKSMHVDDGSLYQAVSVLLSVARLLLSEECVAGLGWHRCTLDRDFRVEG